MSLAILRGEMKSNFTDFTAQWTKELDAVSNQQAAHFPLFEDSYIRIASIQAWRTSVVEQAMDDDCAAFFFEAQNDLLISHCLATCGSYRQALKALRSFIENVLCSLYYMDHPVELQKWLQGKSKIGFSDLYTYFSGHPLIDEKSLNRSGMPEIAKEYATLSKAVHASAKQFRMTTDLSDTKLWVADAVAIAKWGSNERNTVLAINMLLLQLFFTELTGAKNRPLRDMLGLVVPKKSHADIETRLAVTLPK